MANVQKYKASSTGQLCQHYERKKDENGAYIKFGNQEIDLNRTRLNYNLAPDRDIGQIEFIRKRKSEVKCHNRSDVNIMCTWAITAPKDLPVDDLQKFFKESYDFMTKRYGGEKNVVSAYVHMDEHRPHMHFVFIPVAIDKKKGIEKISAKEVITKIDLQTFHKDLDNRMTEVFGRDIGILNEATKEGNKSIDDLKRKSASERLQEANQKAREIIESGKQVVANNVGQSQERLKEVEQECSTMLSNARQEAQAIKDSLVPLRTEYKARKAFIEQAKKDSEVSMMYPDYAKISKGVFGKQEYVTVPKEKWEAKHVSANEVNALEKAEEALEKGIVSIKKSAPAQKIKALEDEVNELRTENRAVNLKLEKAYKEIERVNKVFEKQPEIKKAFFDAEKTIARPSKKQDIGR